MGFYFWKEPGPLDEETISELEAIVMRMKIQIAIRASKDEAEALRRICAILGEYGDPIDPGELGAEAGEDRRKEAETPAPPPKRGRWRTWARSTPAPPPSDRNSAG